MSGSQRYSRFVIFGSPMASVVSTHGCSRGSNEPGTPMATGITFRSLYDLHHQRYSVYWPLQASK